jgi:glycosyltransferase involved in cell wall biosynthesis
VVGLTRRLVFANNYSMTKAFRDVAAGRYPRQHLYGADALAAAGWDVTVAPYAETGLAPSLTRRMRWRAGDLGQQGAVVRSRLHGRVACYAAEPNTLAAVAYLHGVKLWRGPVVTVLHTVPRRTARTVALLRGYDAILCLSSYVRDELLERFDLDPARVAWAAWGPDLGFAGYRATPAAPGDRVVSSGKTNRDQQTLLAALDGARTPATVYARSPRGLPAVDGVELVTDETHEETVEPDGPKFSYGHVLKDLVAASVVAIPLRDPDVISGLSELNDALALGKPVVVTRTEHLRDVDVERIGCGFVVDAGDVQGWRRALTTLRDDPVMRERMGARGRAFAESEWNAGIFGTAVVEALASVT